MVKGRRKEQKRAGFTFLMIPYLRVSIRMGLLIGLYQFLFLFYEKRKEGTKGHTVSRRALFLCRCFYCFTFFCFLVQILSPNLLRGSDKKTVDK